MNIKLFSAMGAAFILSACAGTWDGVKSDASRASSKIENSLDKTGNSIERQWDKTSDTVKENWDKLRDGFK